MHHKWKRVLKLRLFISLSRVFLILVGLGLSLVPSLLWAAAAVQPVRCIGMVANDNVGNDLSYPSSLFYDPAADEIYVTSPLKNKLVLFTADYFPYMSVGAGRGLHAVTSCYVSDNRLYACAGASKDEPRGHLVMLNGAFLPEGKIFFSGFEGADVFLPRRVVVGANGNIYVTGLTGVGVVVLDPAGNFLKTIEPRDDVLGVTEQVAIISMTVGANGNLYLLSEGMGRVYVYDRNEKFLYKFGQKGGESGKLARPRGLAVDDRAGRVYVVDYQRHAVSAFSLQGEFLFEFGGMGQARGWLNYPSDVCVDSFGRIIVADTFNHRIQIYEVVGGGSDAAPEAVAALPEVAVESPEAAEDAPPKEAAVVTMPPVDKRADRDKAPEVLPEAPRDDYVLQVAFAREPEAAQALLERLTSRNYQVFIYEVDRGDRGLWYKVLIGPFVERSEAEAVAARLKAEEKLTAIVSKR